MANGKQVMVGTEPTLLSANSGFLRIRNTSAASVFLGGDGVTASTGAGGGYELEPGEPLQIGSRTGDPIYAVAEGSGYRVDVLEVD